VGRDSYQKSDPHGHAIMEIHGRRFRFTATARVARPNSACSGMWDLGNDEFPLRLSALVAEESVRAATARAGAEFRHAGN